MKNNKYKVSVIVPVYNVYDYLEKCVDSLVNQTLDDIQIILVNDGSPDNSQEIIDKYVKKYPDKVFGYLKKNGGLSDARNFGVQKATGEYLAFVDSDDYVDLEMFESMYDKAKETSADVVVCGITSVYEKSDKLYYFPNIKIFGNSAITNPKILLDSKSYAWNKLYSRSMWEKNKFLFPIQLFEDSALIYNILLKANKIECINIPYYHYLRYRPDSIVNKVDDRVFDIFKSGDSIIKICREEGFSLQIRETLESIAIIHICVRINYIDKADNRELLKKFIRYSREYFDKNIPDWRYNTYFNKHHMYYKLLDNPNNVDNILKSRSVKKVLKNNIKKLKKEVVKLFLSKKRAKKVKETKRNAIQTNGYYVLDKVFKIFNDNNIEHFADFGTLLGIVREKQLLKHDLDIDIGIFLNDMDISVFRTLLQKNNFSLSREYYFNNRVVGQSWMVLGIKLGFCFYERNENSSKAWLFYNDPEIKYSGYNRSIVELTYSRIDKYQDVEIKGYTYQIPVNAVKLLEEKYGDGWKVPDKNWIYYNSPAAKKMNDLGYYKTYKILNAPEVSKNDFKEELKQLHLIEIDILKEIDKICKKNNIKYYMGEGSLLGTIRHQGFIPWDDDVDILMLRSDYERFLKIAPKQISKDYEIQHSSTIKNYWSSFIKVRYLGESNYKQKHIAHLTEHNGPLIDVFPLDNVPSEWSMKQKIQAFKIRFFKGMLSYKLGVRKPTKKKGYIFKFCSMFFSLKGIHKNLNKTFVKYNNDSNKYVVNLASYYSAKKQTVPKEWYGDARIEKFESINVPVPNEAELLLESIYGDYMTLPPVNKRVIKHHF